MLLLHPGGNMDMKGLGARSRRDGDGQYPVSTLQLA